MTEFVTKVADEILEQSKGKYSVALVVGINEANQLDISSTNNSYPVLQWLLNKAQFELNIHEKNTTGVVIEGEAAADVVKET